MTELLFYHMQEAKLGKLLPPLLEKSLARSWRVVVESGSEERADMLDAHLWTYSDDSFLPHTTWRASDAAEQPIVLTAGPGNPNSATVRVLVDSAALPADAQHYNRVVLMFSGEDVDAVEGARAAWREGKARGFDVTYWQTDDRGRWQRRE